MNENPQPPKFQAWLGPVVIGLLMAQLGLLWVQGGLLHRQHQDIQGLREDLQGLTESIDQGTSGVPEEEGLLLPAHKKRPGGLPHRPTRVVHIVQEEQPDQQAAKDLEAAKESAQKALKDAREVQDKLSFTENARLAKEKAKIENAKRAWQKWLWMGVGAALVALVTRSWLRRRG